MRLYFPSTLRRTMRREVRSAGRVEIGGVLMAQQIDPGHFCLEDFTVDGQKGGAAHFVRSVADHQAALAKFFERTGSNYLRFNYLGEWHSHPNHAPIPSSEDAASMTSLVEGERDIPFALLLIVRSNWRKLMLCATLFERGQQPRPVNIKNE